MGRTVAGSPPGRVGAPGAGQLPDRATGWHDAGHPRVPRRRAGSRARPSADQRDRRRLADSVAGPVMDARLARLQNRLTVAGEVAAIARTCFTG
ncbi:MAG: hypothetical protein ACRDOK_24170 [Streptosporangiaceae bacterium]